MAALGSDSNSCKNNKQGETISYGVNGWGRDRKIVVSYYRSAISYSTDVDRFTSFREVNFENKGRDIDVTFSLNRDTGPASIRPVGAQAEIPFPLKFYSLPKGYAMKNMRLNVYTKLDDDKPVLKCKKELEYAHPTKMSLRERAMDYLGLNRLFCEQ